MHVYISVKLELSWFHHGLAVREVGNRVSETDVTGASALRG